MACESDQGSPAICVSLQEFDSSGLLRFLGKSCRCGSLALFIELGMEKGKQSSPVLT